MHSYCEKPCVCVRIIAPDWKAQVCVHRSGLEDSRTVIRSLMYVCTDNNNNHNNMCAQKWTGRLIEQCVCWT